MQLPREVSKWYSGFTPLNPGAMFLLVPSDVLSAFAAYHVVFRGNIRTKKLFLVAMRTRDNDAKAPWLGLVLAGLQLLSFWPDNYNDKKIWLQDYKHNMNCAYCK
jgi:hypothetical protein